MLIYIHQLFSLGIDQTTKAEKSKIDTREVIGKTINIQGACVARWRQYKTLQGKHSHCSYLTKKTREMVQKVRTELSINCKNCIHPLQ